MSQLPSFTTDFLRSKKDQTLETEQIIDPVQEEAKRKTAQEKWKTLLSNHIEEGKRYGRSEIDSMDRAVYLSRVATPEETREYNWAFGNENFPDRKFAQGVPWRKWGGGRKQGSGKGAKRENMSPLGLSFSLGQFGRDVAARFSPTQGKNPDSAEGFGYSNHSRQNTFNTHGVGKRADGSRSTFSVGNFRGFNTLGD
tara:strand:- start:9494 stop:10084 length:591 start_codon:yes stop_codon:yes gene_type:complete